MDKSFVEGKEEARKAYYTQNVSKGRRGINERSYIFYNDVIRPSATQ